MSKISSLVSRVLAGLERSTGTHPTHLAALLAVAVAVLEALSGQYAAAGHSLAVALGLAGLLHPSTLPPGPPAAP